MEKFWHCTIQIGARTQSHLRWDSNPAKTQDLMQLRFFMSQHRRDSVRDKVIGKKWIYSERYTFHRQNAVGLKRREWPPNVGWLVFMDWVIS